MITSHPHPARRLLAAAAAALLLSAAVPGAASAQGAAARGDVVGRVAAVVNDEPITAAALDARERLVILGSGLPNTPETRDRIRQQVLRTLIDEALQRQEARRLNVSVSADEVARAIAGIASQNRLTADQLRQLLRQNDIPMSTMEAQVRAALAWNRVVQRRFRPQLEVGDDDVDAVLERIEASIGRPEFLVAEMFLGVDRPEQDDDVRGLAQRLVDQMRAGASFPEVARQFSQGAGAAGGGDLGWVQEGQLLDELDQAVRGLRPGEISRPVRSATGWHVLFLRDRRTVTGGDPDAAQLVFRRVLIPAPPVADPFEIIAQAQRTEAVRARIAGCDGMDAVAAAGAEVGPEQRVPVRAVPPDLARILQPLTPGEASAPLRTAEGVNVFVLCERVEEEVGAPSRDRIREQLLAERLDMMQRRLIRDLRRQAFVDIRV